MSINHGKRIISEVYYAGELASSSTDIEVSQFTDKQMLLRDIIDGLTVITSGQTRKLAIEISLDKQNRYKLTKRYTAQQEKYDR